MTQREKILGAVVAAMVLFFGGGRLWTRYTKSLAEKRSQLLVAQERLGAAKLELAKGEAAVRQLQKWQDRSLPADREAAQMAYRVWLQQQLQSAGLAVEEVQPQQRLAPAAGYSAIGYTLNVHGNMQALTKFLDAYYRSELLQQITRMQLRPDTNPAQLKISLQTEALVLPGTFNEKLPTGTVERSAKPNAADYAKSIGGRNVFTVYRPPRPERPATASRPAPPPSKFDNAKFAFFTGTIQVDGRYQAWIHVRTTNETLRLFEGDPVKIGEFDGQIVSIEPRAIVVKSGDEEVRVNLGQNLREGKSTTAQTPAEGSTT
ncbi:MAG: hypothetical protein AB7G28_04995 [Pirellulales bacterium]